MAGGVDAATHAVRVDPGGWFVVERLRAKNAASLVGEFERLRFAQRAPVATPDPVALDVEGSWFGHPALVEASLRFTGAHAKAVGAELDDRVLHDL